MFDNGVLGELSELAKSPNAPDDQPNRKGNDPSYFRERHETETDASKDGFVPRRCFEPTPKCVESDDAE